MPSSRPPMGSTSGLMALLELTTRSIWTGKRALMQPVWVAVSVTSLTAAARLLTKPGGWATTAASSAMRRSETCKPMSLTWRLRVPSVPTATCRPWPRPRGPNTILTSTVTPSGPRIRSRPSTMEGKRPCPTPAISAIVIRHLNGQPKSWAWK